MPLTFKRVPRHDGEQAVYTRKSFFSQQKLYPKIYKEWLIGHKRNLRTQ